MNANMSVCGLHCDNPPMQTTPSRLHGGKMSKHSPHRRCCGLTGCVDLSYIRSGAMGLYYPLLFAVISVHLRQKRVLFYTDEHG